MACATSVDSKYSSLGTFPKILFSPQLQAHFLGAGGASTDRKNMTLRIGVDTGGTFTDLCAFDEATGQVHVRKVSSTRHDP